MRDPRLNGQSAAEVTEVLVSNVMDDGIITQKLISSYFIGSPTLSSYLAPRTWGVRLGLQW